MYRGLEPHQLMPMTGVHQTVDQMRLDVPLFTVVIGSHWSL